MKHLVTISILIATLVLLVVLLPQPQANDGETPSFAITDVRLFDGQHLHERVTVLVRDGRIEAVGPDLDVPSELERIDGRDHTLLPGMIDAHTHSFGRARKDALRFGVTTMLDMFTSPDLLLQARAGRDDLEPGNGADLYSAGVLATAEEGHGTQYGVPVPTVEDAADAGQWVQSRLAEGSDYIKIVIEPGRAWGHPMPTLDEETVRALVAATHQHDRLAVAHVSTLDDAVMAVRAGVDGLVHIFADQPVSEEFIELARRHEVFVVPTIVVLAGMSNQLDIESRIAEAGVDERLSQEQRQSLTQQGWARMHGEQFLSRAMANSAALHQAGVPLLAGSDAPNPGTAHGLSVHHELEFLVEAGLSPLEALEAATHLPARRFGLDDRGCIQQGCRADLVLVDGRPDQDIETTRRIVSVWKNGYPVALEADQPSAGNAGREATNLLSPSELSHWQAADDRFMGGNSTATIAQQQEGLVRVSGEIAADGQFRYAGLMWAASTPFMSSADLSDRNQLSLRLEGDDGPWVVMLFSGNEPGGRPEQIPMQSTDDGARLEIDLSELVAVDTSNLQAIGIFAVGEPRTFHFDLIEARLR